VAVRHRISLPLGYEVWGYAGGRYPLHHTMLCVASHVRSLVLVGCFARGRVCASAPSFPHRWRLASLPGMASVHYCCRDCGRALAPLPPPLPNSNHPPTLCALSCVAIVVGCRDQGAASGHPAPHQEEAGEATAVCGGPTHPVRTVPRCPFLAHGSQRGRGVEWWCPRVCMCMDWSWW
jgi:hypothetical protein